MVALKKSPRSKNPAHAVWIGARHRCTSPKNPAYPRYGGRGIRMCEEWAAKNGFEVFLAHVGPRPSLKHELDRIDNDRGYEPGNVRWVLRKINLRNRRTCRPITVNGETKHLVEWGEHVGVSPATIAARIRRGWPIEKAIFTPLPNGEIASWPFRTRKKPVKKLAAS